LRTDSILVTKAFYFIFEAPLLSGALFFNIKIYKQLLMKTNLVIVLLIASGFFTACSSNNKTAASASDSTSAAQEIKFKSDTIANVYNHYILLKDALVKSDSVAAAEAGTDLAAVLKNIKGCENTAFAATEIGKTTDLAQQRSTFISLSSDIVAMFKNTDLETGSVFVEFCPMANEGKGAYWLASTKEIRNPYYGNEMLECGEVKQEIKHTN
jgi:hypothetical protein